MTNSTISESNLNNFSRKPLVYKPNIYPQSLNTSLPRNYFVSLFIGSRGTGKTHTICKLSKQYELADYDGKQAMRFIIFSLTRILY